MIVENYIQLIIDHKVEIIISIDSGIGTRIWSGKG